MNPATNFRAGALAGMLMLCPLPAAAQQQRPTLEQFLSAPFATELIAAPVGGKVAWVENVLGARNIWIAEPPDYQGRQLTRYSGDDGKYLVQLAFTPGRQHYRLRARWRPHGNAPARAP